MTNLQIGDFKVAINAILANQDRLRFSQHILAEALDELLGALTTSTTAILEQVTVEQEGFVKVL